MVPPFSQHEKLRGVVLARVCSLSRRADVDAATVLVCTGDMDDATIRSLRVALDASPDNTALRMVLVRAHVDRGETEEAGALVGDRVPADFAIPADRATVAELLLACGQLERALAFASLAEVAPEGELVCARVLLARGDQKGAMDAYRSAVGRNPTLEDLDLKAALTARVSEHESGDSDRPRLRVIANDDTDDTEVDRLLHPEAKTVTFADVGGLDEIKRQIDKRIILPFQKPSLFERFKKRVGGGILLYGPPGCGKTLLARATAGQCDAAFFNVTISDVLDMYIGESERKLHAVFERARDRVPAVLFFDELEALAGKRKFSREGTSSKLVSQFLSEMDGFSQNNKGVLILGATNVPWGLDPAFRRPGRFDRVLFVPPPDRAARAAILRLQLQERPCQADLPIDFIARKSGGFSGADLENLVETAADAAIEESLERGEEVPLSAAHLKHALTQVKATTLEWLTTARNHARYANDGGQYDEVLAFLKRYGKS